MGRPASLPSRHASATIVVCMNVQIAAAVGCCTVHIARRDSIKRAYTELTLCRPYKRSRVHARAAVGGPAMAWPLFLPRNFRLVFCAFQSHSPTPTRLRQHFDTTCPDHFSKADYATLHVTYTGQETPNPSHNFAKTDFHNFLPTENPTTESCPRLPSYTTA